MLESNLTHEAVNIHTIVSRSISVCWQCVVGSAGIVACTFAGIISKEYDDERSGNFEPLRFVSDNKRVVLGLITTKSPVLEDKATIIARIREAGKYIPLERLSLSPQCGFASCEIGNKLTEAEQWAKLDLVREIAQEVWG